MRYVIRQHHYDVGGCPVLFVDSSEKIERVQKMLADATRIGVDVEAYGFKINVDHPFKVARMASLQFTCDGPKLKGVHEAKYIFVPNWDRFKGTYRHFREALESSERKKVLHNNKFDFHVLANEGIKIRGLRSDTMAKAYLLNTAQRLALKDLMRRVFDEDCEDFGDVFRMPKLKKNGEPGKTTMIPDLLEVARGQHDWYLKNGLKRLVKYAVKDTEMDLRLDTWLDKKLSNIEWYGGKHSMLDYYEKFDLPYAEVLFKMERRGVRLDLEKLEHLQHVVGKAAIEAEAKFYKTCVKLGVSPSSIEGFHLKGKNSKKNLEHLFVDLLGVELPKTKKGNASTSEANLSNIKSKRLRPLLNLLAEYRNVQGKLLDTYINPFLKVGSAEHLDGMLRTIYKQNGAVTGRLSSATPNLQNVPRVGEDESDQFGIRGAFIADDNDCELGDGDLSQIEMRMMAHVTKDKILVEALKNGWDLHARTAIVCFPEVAAYCRGKTLSKELLKKVKEKFPAQRQGAKTLNFMIAYGGGPSRYALLMGTNMFEGKRAINAFFGSYTGLKRGIDSVINYARKHGYVRTILNRRIHVPDIGHPDVRFRARAERQAFNYVAQGGAGEWLKMAMLLIDQCPKLEKLGVEMRMQIHDELVVNVEKGRRDKAKPLLEDYMSNPHKHFGLKGLVVETPADFGFAANWLEAKAV